MGETNRLTEKDRNKQTSAKAKSNRMTGSQTDEKQTQNIINKNSDGRN